MSLMLRVARAIALASLFIGPVHAQSDPVPNTWSLTGSLPSPKYNHTLIVFDSGGALAAGGCDTFSCTTPSRASSTYDPATGLWTPAGDLVGNRTSHAATLLADGRVLASGGCVNTVGCTGIATAELFDPGSRTWQSTGALNTGRRSHVSLRLADGRVLVTGGIGICNSQVCTTLASSEIYDPQTGQWTGAAPMPQQRVGHVATLLNDGRVLVVGGCAGTGLPCAASGAIAYDPALNAWSAAGAVLTPRTQATVTKLADGSAILAAGLNSQGFMETNVERYDPALNAWSAAGSLLVARVGATASLLQTGQILIAGGSGASAELYDPATTLSNITGSMVVARGGFPAVALQTGDVLAAGGVDQTNTAVASAELYHPGAGPLARLSTGALDFGLVEAGTVAGPLFVDVTNNGTPVLVIDSLSLSGPARQEYFATRLCPGGIVQPGASCRIAVQFVPMALRQRNARLGVHDNAPDSPQNVSLTGFAYAIASNQWAPGDDMAAGRSEHTATILNDGTVLLAGGSASPSADTFDPASGTSEATGPMTTTRHAHTATLLDDGRVLVAGGGRSSAELYDASSRSWSATGGMVTSRRNAVAALLPDGRVLAAGGCDGNPCASAELYDPAQGTWGPAAPMNINRAHATATTLADGRILVAGGGSSTAEVYEPSTGRWLGTGHMRQSRSSHTATRLADGRVLVAGGCSDDPCKSAEIYDPVTNRWTPAANMTRGHVRHAAAALADGRVLVSGGTYFCDPEFGFCFTTDQAEIYSPATNRWIRTGKLIAARELHTATLLPDGRVLVTGGVSDTHVAPYGTTELFTP